MTNLIRIIKSGVLAFWRNRWLSVATVSVMSLAIFVITSLIFVNVLSEALLQSLQDKIDISIYFKMDTEEGKILDIQSDLSSMEEVKSVEYVSRETALAEFKDKHSDNEVLMQSLDELDGNPLQATLNIKTKLPSQFALVAGFLENAQYRQLIDKVNYQQNKEVIEKFSNFSNLFRRVGLIVSIFLVVIAVLVAFNTIRLAMFNMKDEINVMKLVGAGNWYVQGPFMVEGMIHGIIATIVSLVFIYPVLIWLSPKITNILPNSNLLEWFRMNFWEIMLFQLIVGIGLGAVSSLIAIRRYLKV